MGDLYLEVCDLWWLVLEVTPVKSIPMVLVMAQFSYAV
jgi:hypothetical protein